MKFLNHHINLKKTLQLFSFFFFAFNGALMAQNGNYFSQQWRNMKTPTAISFASSNIHFAKDRVPAIINQKKWTTNAWQNEKVNTQILVWTTKPITKLSVKLNDLKSETGQVIKTENIISSFLTYTLSDGYFGNGCSVRKNSELDSSLVADIIDTITVVGMKANSVQPLWIEVAVPQSISPGNYNGNLTVYADAVATQLQITIIVDKKSLPTAKNWAFDLDLWQHPAAIARYHELPLWSDAHFKAMKPYYTLLASAGQKVITASIVKEPWGHQTYDDFPSLIKWIKQKDGSWKYDYSLFDKYISFVMDCGITKRINCYTMVSWNTDFNYYDEALNRNTTMKLVTSTPLYNMVWKTFLKDFTLHLKEKKWFDITHIAMDERPLETMQQVIGLLKSVDPKWKISLAGRYHPELVNEIDDYSVFKTYTFTKKELEERKKLGKATTFYTSCEGEYPNMFTFSSPAEATWMAWFAQSKGYTGYLRWAFNSWTKNPIKDSRFTKFASGDTFQIYPGPKRSVRFEKLVEGIQDFEKILILKQEFTATKNALALKKLEAILAQFDNEALEVKSASELMNDAKKALNDLQQTLPHKKSLR